MQHFVVECLLIQMDLNTSLGQEGAVDQHVSIRI